MKTSPHYAADHLLAKVMVYLAYLLVGAISIEAGNAYVALVFGTAIWLFGINTAAYVVESVRHHEHCHNVW
jgi:hypothetical protein